MTGRVLDNAYRLVRLIAVGGMGSVYEAIQLRLNKRVAIKLMSRDLTANQIALRRFRREAEITSQLGHPHLVNVMDFGTTDTGEPYMVMEYLEGEDLDHRLTRVGRLSPEAAVPIVRQVASGLTAAHARGIVHRDMKPANIFLVAAEGVSDYVKVLDFGISKVKSARTNLTRPNTAMGTPYYMSPEQATGRTNDMDQGADQWALACIAYECIAGRRPFSADDATAVLYQIIHMAPPPLAEYAPSLRPEAEQVLLRALSKRPADRFRSIHDFAYAFDTAVFDRPAEITLIPQSLHTPRPSARMGAASPSGGVDHAHTTGEQAQKAQSGPWGTEEDEAKQPVPASISASEVTSIVPRRWFRPRNLITVAASAAVLFMGWFIFFKSARTLAPTRVSTPPATVTPAVVTPLPAPEPASAPAAVPAEEPRPVPASARPPGRKGKKQAGSAAEAATRSADLRVGSKAPDPKHTPSRSTETTSTTDLPGGFRW